MLIAKWLTNLFKSPFLAMQASLASALGGLQIGEASPQRGWHVELVVEVLQSAVPDLNPEAVMEALDHDDFFVPDARGFLVIISAWRKLSPQPFPLQASRLLLTLRLSTFQRPEIS